MDDRVKMKMKEISDRYAETDIITSRPPVQYYLDGEIFTHKNISALYMHTDICISDTYSYVRTALNILADYYKPQCTSVNYISDIKQYIQDDQYNVDSFNKIIRDCNSEITVERVDNMKQFINEIIIYCKTNHTPAVDNIHYLFNEKINHIIHNVVYHKCFLYLAKYE